MRRTLHAATLALALAVASPCLGTTAWEGHTARIESDTVAHDTLKKKRRNIITMFLDYLESSNKPKPNRKFDFSILGGPHYATDTKLGLGLVAEGLYRTDRGDSTLRRSNVDLYGDITTANFYLIGIRGTHIFPHDAQRLIYKVVFDSFDSEYWGIGYQEGNDDRNKCKMGRIQATVSATYLRRMATNLYAGVTAVYDYLYARDIEKPSLLHGMDAHTWNVGVGLAVEYDSRDVLTNPQRGIYATLTQTFRPRFMGNEYAFSTTDFRFSLYRKTWKGAIIAGDMRGTLNFGNPSWGMMARLGNSYSMRGYYEGRYRDKHKLEAQVELRQHIWKRNSMVAWAGVGTVFDHFSAIEAQRLLPNFGIGYRWEFKKNVNIRLDYGFGKAGQNSFIFNINEAF